MRQEAYSYESIASLLYRFVLEEADEKDLSDLQCWSAESIYNRGLLEDVRTDMKLRALLIESYYSDPSQFWKVVVCHRAALHNGMPGREGNFWERLTK